MKTQSKKIYLIVGGLIASFILSSAFLISQYKSGLKKSFEAQFFFAKEPYLLQSNPNLKKIKIGEQGQTLFSHGSGTLSLSMALHAMGWKLSPEELAALLLKEKAYDENGEPKWYAVTAITGGKLDMEIPTSPNRSLILKSLKKGQPVIAQIENTVHGKHWVMIVGKRDSQLIIKNPLSIEKVWETIESPTTQVHKILILKKRGQWSL